MAIWGSGIMDCDVALNINYSLKELTGLSYNKPTYPLPCKLRIEQSCLAIAKCDLGWLACAAVLLTCKVEMSENVKNMILMACDRRLKNTSSPTHPFYQQLLTVQRATYGQKVPLLFHTKPVD